MRNAVQLEVGKMGVADFCFEQGFTCSDGETLCSGVGHVKVEES